MSGVGRLDGIARDAAARALARGLTRHLLQRGLMSLTEMTLPNGRRADLVALSARGEIWIVEIKSSVEDFRVDQKWRDYAPFCDRFYFASHPDVPAAIFPQDVGFILADAFGAEIIRDATPNPLSAPTRKALTIAFARLAAARALAFLDPEAQIPEGF